MVSDYSIVETLYRGRGTVVFRAIRASDQAPVLLKVLYENRPFERELEHLKNEQEIGQKLGIAAVVRPLGLDTWQGMPALVLEDTGGVPLDSLLGAPLEVGAFLQLAARLARAVAEVHDHDVVHKDIKPSNIMVSPATGEVKLSDFGIAFSGVSRRSPGVSSAGFVEGTPAYMPPEQTGRMNRGVDSRSDLYALGVTFYEVLTGRLPFEAKDPLEWGHCHLALVPPSPAEWIPGLPDMLSRVVMKLLAKLPEDRYQSARGLAYDIEICRSRWESKGAIEPFALGAQDRSTQFRLTQKLYGREEESGDLTAAFERVSAVGGTELVLVSGSPGIGKSSLVQELRKPIVERRGLFASGKFDQYMRDVPYSTIVQAFRHLVLEILAGSAEHVDVFRRRIQAALGEDGGLVADLVPQIELIIGEQAPVPDLPLGEAQRRFNAVLRRFTATFASREHPLTLFLDDLQWADAATLALIEDLVTQPEVQHLLLVGAYRSNEVSASHPLSLLLANVRRAGGVVLEIVLAPLRREHIGLLVADTLQRRPEEVEPLARAVYDKTGGNPFFAIQFLTILHEDHLVFFDPRAEAWRWDLEAIGARGYTDNVVDLMVEKIQRLPASTQEALRLSACIGHSVDLGTLSVIHGQTPAQTRRDLEAAVGEGLLAGEGDIYRFAHDRVQQAAYLLIQEDRRAALHLSVGRLLLDHATPETIGEQVFGIVNQLNIGASLLVDQS
jgi:hypothetical protein